MKTKLLLVLIMVFGTLVRFYHLDISPGGLYADEASIGWNAYSVLTTGQDEHGIHWPIFFRAFGEYKNPVFIYSLMPLIAVFGLAPLTVRAGAALWGSLTLPLMFYFVRRLTKDTRLSLMAVFIFSLMPWHLHYSRLGFEAITLPALMLLGLLFYLNNRFLLQGLTFGLGFYSYTTARLWMPFLMLWFKPRFWAWLGFLLLLLPAFFWERQFPGSLTARFNQISVISDRPAPAAAAGRILATYLGHWQPQFLFGRGDTTLRHSSGTSSEMLTVWLPFFLTGAWLYRKNRLIMAMLIFFPLAAALTRTSPIATRTIQAAPFFALVIARGALALKRPVFIGLFVLISFLEFSHYYRDLIFAYPDRVAMPWHGFDAELGPTLTAAYQESLNTGAPLYLSDKIEQARVQGLFWTKEKLPIINTDVSLPSGITVLTRADCGRPVDYCVVSRP